MNGRLLSFSNFSVLQCVGTCMCPCVHAHCGLSRTSEFHQPPSTDSHGYGQSQEITPSPEKVLFLHLIWATNNGGDIGAVKGYGKVPFNMAHALSCHPHSRHMWAAVQSQQTQQVYFKVYLLIQPYLIYPKICFMFCAFVLPSTSSQFSSPTTYTFYTRYKYSWNVNRNNKTF